MATSSTVLDVFNLAALEARLAARTPRPWSGAADAARAAVAAVVRDSASGPEILLIRRSTHPEDPWSGHMAFPGGRAHPEDPDLRFTSVRETREEVGLELDRVGRLLGRLDDLPAIARARFQGLVITPWVFRVEGTPELVISNEVAEVLWAPLGPMWTGATATVRPYVWEGRSIEFPAYDVEGRIVWGLTYQMLQSLFAVMREP